VLRPIRVSGQSFAKLTPEIVEHTRCNVFKFK